MSESVKEFIDDLAKRDFIVFAGAGVVGETGVSPSWVKLLEAFKKNEPSVVSENVDEIRESEYPNVAQRIFDRLREQQKEVRYHDILREELRAKRTNWSPQEFDIVDTAKRVVTTNFDDGFECALDRILENQKPPIRIVQSLPDLKAGALSKEYSISYLHGRVKEECVVFKLDDYKTFYPSQFGNSEGCDNLERFLRCIYEEQTLVFVGFSFRDECFLKALQEIQRDLERNDAVGEKVKPTYEPVLLRVQHYVCLQEFDRKRESEELNRDRKWSKAEISKIVGQNERRDAELEMMLESMKMKVLRYKEHKDWTEWFGRIRQLRRLAPSASKFERP